MNVAGLGLPEQGDLIACNGIVYEWDVLREDDHREHWGWAVLCGYENYVDAGLTGGDEIEVVESLPAYDA